MFSASAPACGSHDRPNRVCCQKRWFQTKIHSPDANGTIKRSCRSVQAEFSCPQSVSNEQPRCRFTSSCTSPSANQSCVGLYEKDFVFLRHARLRTNCVYLETSSSLHLSSYWLKATSNREQVPERL